jgi:hypothetical protein
MANEVPGVVVPPEIVTRMQKASAQSREKGLETGIAIAREMLDRVRSSVQGIQVSAPFGKVAFALQVFDGIAGIDPSTAEPPIEPGEEFGFVPPWNRPPDDGSAKGTATA